MLPAMCPGSITVHNRYPKKKAASPGVHLQAVLIEAF